MQQQEFPALVVRLDHFRARILWVDVNPINKVLITAMKRVFRKSRVIQVKLPLSRFKAWQQGKEFTQATEFFNKQYHQQQQSFPYPLGE